LVARGTGEDQARKAKEGDGKEGAENGKCARFLSGDY